MNLEHTFFYFTLLFEDTYAVSIMIAMDHYTERTLHT